MSKNLNLAGGFNFTTGKSKPLITKETATSATIGEYLDLRNIYNLRLNSGRAKGFKGGIIHLCPAGTPDRFAIYRGIPLFIEVKRVDEEPTPVQLACHELIRKAGGRVIWVTDVDDVRRELKLIDELLDIPFN